MSEREKPAQQPTNVKGRSLTHSLTHSPTHPLTPTPTVTCAIIFPRTPPPFGPFLPTTLRCVSEAVGDLCAQAQGTMRTKKKLSTHTHTDDARTHVRTCPTDEPKAATHSPTHSLTHSLVPFCPPRCDVCVRQSVINHNVRTCTWLPHRQ